MQPSKQCGLRLHPRFPACKAGAHRQCRNPHHLLYEPGSALSIPTPFLQPSCLRPAPRLTRVRAFQSYVLDKLDAQAARNDYLTRPQKPNSARYPQGQERTAINAAFDHLIDTLETKATDQGTALYEPEAPYGRNEFAETARLVGGRDAWERTKDAGRTVLNYRQWVEVRTPAFKRWFGDWEAVRMQQRVDAMPSIQVPIPAGWESLTTEELRHRVSSALDEAVHQRTVLMHPELGEIRIGRKGQRKTINAGTDPGKLLIANALNRVIPRAIPGPVMSGTTTGIIARENLLARVQVGSTEMIAMIAVNRQSDGRWYYNTVTLEDSQRQNDPDGSYASPSAASSGAGSGETLLTRVNSFIRPAFRRVNPATVSKVVHPETGEPLVVYHGTNVGFTQFDKSTVKSRFPYSLGFHFTTRPPEADVYAGPITRANEPSVMPVYLKAKHPLVLHTDHVSASMELDLNRAEVTKQLLDARDVGDPYDSVIAKRTRGDEYDGWNIFAFEPTQIKSATANDGTFDADDPSIVSEPDATPYAPTFFSPTTRLIDQKMPNRATFEQIANILKAAKPDELKWTGLDDYLKTKEAFTKQEILDYLRSHQVQVQEVMKGGPHPVERQARIEEYRRRREEINRPRDYGGQISHHEANRRLVALRRELGLDDEEDTFDRIPTKFAQYQLPGGTDYRELLLTLPSKRDALTWTNDEYKEYQDLAHRVGGFSAVPATPAQRARFKELRDKQVKANAADFTSSHWSEPNVLAHVRFTIRILPNGKKVLFIEEIQSDWHQKGRKDGYRGDDSLSPEDRTRFERLREVAFGDMSKEDLAFFDATKDKVDRMQSAVPDAPFKKTWHELALRRMLRYAAEHGCDSLAWTTGAQQNARYDLRKQVQSIHAIRNDFGKYVISFFDKRGHQHDVGGEYSAEDLPDVVGKELAQKIVDNPEHDQRYSGLDLQVGGSGMKGFYDQIILAYLNKYGKKWGAQVADIDIPIGETPLETIAEGLSRSQASALARENPMYRVQPNSRGYYDVVAIKSTEQVHALPITDAMRTSVLTDGQALFDKNEGNYELRPGEQQSLNFELAHEALGDLDRTSGVSRTGREISGDRIPATTVALGISPDLIHQGTVDLTGYRVSSAEDLAKLAQVYRDPRFETFRIIYLQGKRIVGHEGMTSRLPGLVKVFTSREDADAKFAAMREHMDRLGANGYYLLHNHPSGNSTPSEDDFRTTQRFDAALPGFKGHVVIDSNEYTAIEFNPEQALESQKQLLDLGPDRLLTPSIDHPLLGTPLINAGEVAAVGKAMQAPSGFATVVYSSGGKTRAIQEVSAEFLTDPVQARTYLNDQAVAFGASRTFVHYQVSADDPVSASVGDAMEELIRDGTVKDFVTTSAEHGWSMGLRDAGVAKRPGMVMGRKFEDVSSEMVREAEPAYDPLGLAVKPLTYEIPELSKLDDVIRLVQDKNIDTVRLVEAIKQASGAIADDLNPVLKEELYLGRVAHRNETFLNDELKPLVQAMRLSQVSIQALDTYLHARHAKEANAYLRSINEDRQDDTAFWAKPSGMTDVEADRILSSADPKMARLADRVDKILDGTRQLLVDYGLESQATIDAWAQHYQHYVPLYREGKEQRMGTGQGRSVRGPSSKERVGSTRAVEDILAHVAMDREKAIVRGEKMRPVIALAGLLKRYPNKQIATLAKPTTITYTDPDTGLETTMPGQVGEYNVPTIAYKDPRTGQVVHRPDPSYKGRDNVVNFRINGEDRAIIFNEDNERAMQIAQAMKDLDVGQLNRLLSSVGTGTRYFAAINTQYNPIFGLVNFIRDAQFAMLSLSSTPLKGKQAEIVANARQLMAGIYTDARAVRNGQHPTSTAAQLWERFQTVGGPTGYRDLFRTSADRAKAIHKLLDPDWWQKTMGGKVVTAGGLLKTPASFLFSKGGKNILDWLSDYNLTMENAMRLSVFKTGVDAGLTDEQAASLAKNITVNFNKKGQISAQAGALYAFFNASVQGTARLAETLFEPGKIGVLSAAGKKIVAGGVTLGVIQAVTLALSGFDDEEPPEFVKAKNLIIPAPGTDKGYVSIPLPLGFHVLPAFGRLVAESFIYQNPGQKSYDFLSAMLDSFSPVGQSASLVQTLAPTVTDPLLALSENKDWTGKSIYREDFNKLRPTPGFQRAKDSASFWARGLSEAINYATGGTDYVPGKFSPSPDAIDYLIGQAAGGIGRELSKAARWGTGAVTGEEVSMYATPLIGRFAGSVSGSSAARDRFYDTLRRLNEEEAEFKGRREHGEDAASYLRDHPDVRYADAAQHIEREISALTKRKREMVRRGASREMVRLIERQIQARMDRVNHVVAQR